MTDNGSALPLHRSRLRVPRALGVQHLRTRPYRPRTTGKVERFIRTLFAG
jgi:transposase InsO family protein